MEDIDAVSSEAPIEDKTPHNLLITPRNDYITSVRVLLKSLESECINENIMRSVKLSNSDDTDLFIEEVLSALVEGYISNSTLVAKLIQIILESQLKFPLNKKDNLISKKLEKNKFRIELLNNLLKQLGEASSKDNIAKKIACIFYYSLIVIDFLYALREVGVVSMELVNDILEKTGNKIGQLPVSIV